MSEDDFSFFVGVFLIILAIQLLFVLADIRRDLRALLVIHRGGAILVDLKRDMQESDKPAKSAKAKTESSGKDA